jgi:hypothetical protein
MPKLIQANEAIAERRRIFFDIRGLDGITPVDSEDGGQPQITVNGDGGWSSSGVSTLTLIGNGRYYATLELGPITNPGIQIESRYKGLLTVDTPGDVVQVIGYDPNITTNMPGTGTVVEVVTVRDVNNNPIHNVDVWITSDEAGVYIVAGTLKTDVYGQVSFRLNPGNYFLWREHSNYNFTNPKSFSVI